ncbi:hypothetical protein K435DRAFT_649259 [Dendrothele bispora CBS 962.96]|uniref:G-protein coupled receptors family 1 profile domain-containing protein n=1 Tax=Dendrothele bispora (strain CBS 962.96) TaxID=1314807 RepID=A0A4S8MN76_DENBC|nr:hypothetical protein K435DRAFT_649259 [Dendrothele bispora CBS 962.96]
MIAWDILTNINDEIELYSERKIRIPTAVYIFCRTASICYALVATLYLVLDIPNCEEIEFIPPLATAASTNSISLLFLLRVHAVFHEKRKARIFFTIFWIISAATSGLFFKFGDVEQSSVDPRKCAIRKLHPIFSLAAMGFLLVFDTMVYLAISFRLFRIFQFERNVENLLGAGLQHRTSSFFTGRCLPAFSRSFLRDGQLYYTISFLLSIPFIMLSIGILPFIPTQYNTVINIPYITLLSVLACYVFRNTKSGRIREESLSILSSQILSHQTNRADGSQQ